MEQRQLPLLAIIVALLFGLRVPFSTKKAEPTAPTQTAVSEAKATEESAVATSPTLHLSTKIAEIGKPLCSLSETEIYRRVIAEPGGAQAEAGQNEFPECLPPVTKITPLIASVPDRTRTHLGMVVDRTLDALQAAAASKDYLFYELMNLPIKQGGTQRPIVEEATKTPPPGMLIFRHGDQTAKEERYQLSRLQIAHPAAGSQETGETLSTLIFRKSGGEASRDYLVVFLVPEAPTTGINWQIFSVAEDLITQIQKRNVTQIPNQKTGTTPTAKVTVWFAGPLYSGSLEGLVKANSRHPKERCIKAISGTYTNALTNQLTADECDAPQSLQTSDADAINKLLVRTGYKGSQVAVLTEEGTEYGRLENALVANAPEKQIVLLHFPREISRLRNAYGTDTGQAGVSSGQLTVNWRDPRADGGDKLPTFGGTQTDLSQETVLASLANNMKARGIKLLGILATDPWDVAFLVHTFKASCPNIRLFVREADLLYLRTSNVGLLNGVLVVNNFPLVLQNQFWTSPTQAQRRLISFPSGAQEGQFNAFSLLLNEATGSGSPDTLEYGWPQTSRPSSSQERSSSQKANVPAPSPQNDKSPLWMAATGTTGYFPVAILNEGARPKTASAAGAKETTNDNLSFSKMDIGRPPLSAILVWMVFILVGAVHAVALIFRRAVPALFEEEFDFGKENNRNSALKPFLHVLGLLVIACAILVAGSGFLYFWNAQYAVVGVPVCPIIAGATVLGIAMLLGVAIIALWMRVITACAPQPPRSQSRRNTGDDDSADDTIIGPGAAVAGVLVFACPMIVWSATVFRPSYDNAFLHFRDLQLSSGVAPALPILLLLAITYLGIWVYLRRVTFHEYGRVPLLPIEDSTGSVHEFQSKVKKIDLWMRRLPDGIWLAMFLSVLGGALLAFRPWDTMDSFENAGVIGVIIFSTVLAFGLLLINSFRFIGIWRELKIILRRLESLPLRAAFSRLPKQSSSPIWGWRVAHNEFLPVSAAMENLEALVRIDATAISPVLLGHLKKTIRIYARFETKAQHLRSPAASEQLMETRTQELRAAVGGPISALPRPAISQVSTFTAAAKPSVMESPRKYWERFTFSKFRVSRQKTKHLRPVRHAMTEVIKHLLEYLADYWNHGSIPKKSQNSLIEKIKHQPENWSDNPNRASIAKESQETSARDDLRFVLAENIVALRFFTYIRYVITEMRRVLFFMGIALSLLFISLHTYSFRASQSADIFFLFLFFFLGSGVIWVLAQMERDPLLRRLQDPEHGGDHSSGSLGKNFYLNAARYGIIPLLTIVSSQVPLISNLLMGWFQPSVEVLR